MRQPKLNRIKATGTTVGDVYFPKVKLLLPFDGSNGATTTTDSSNSNTTIVLNTDSVISTAQSKFGGSSLYVPEGDHPAGAYFDTTYTLDGDFTIEFWIYRVQSTLTSGGILGFYINKETGHNANEHGGIICGYYVSGDDYLRMYSSTNGSTWNIANGANIGALPAIGSWEHRALVRNGSDWSYYINGSRTYNASLGSDTLYSSSFSALGKAWTSSHTSIEAYYDDFRITLGQARYSGASFTVPTTAHLTSAGDVNKHIVVNSDADGVAIGTGGISQARIAKAWAHFDGTGPTVNGSYNISSITDSAVGKFTANFSEAMADTNYTMHVQGGDGTGPSSPYIVSGRPGAFATGSCAFHVVYVGANGSGDFSAGWYDYTDIAITFFGN